MMHDEEAAGTAMKIEPKNVGPNIKSITFLGSGVTTIGSVGFLVITIV